MGGAGVRRELRGPGGGGVPYLLNWSSDLTYARTGTRGFQDPRSSWAFQASGASAWLAANNPAIFSDGAILLEEARTNLFPDSEDIPNTLTGLGSQTTLIGAVTGPDGQTDGAHFTWNGGGGGQDEAVNNGDPASGDVEAQLHAWAYADGDFSFYYRNAANTVQQQDTSGVGSSSWGHVEVEVSDYDNRFGIRNNTGSPYSGNTRIALIQYEVGAFPTSHIRTSGTAAARGVDQAYIPSASVPDAMKSGRFTIHVCPHESSADIVASGVDRIFLGFGAGASNTIKFQKSGSSAIIRVVQSGTKLSTSALTWSRSQALTLTFDAAAGTLEVSGATSGDGVHSGTAWTMPAGDMYVGNREGYSLPWSGVMGRPIAA